MTSTLTITIDPPFAITGGTIAAIDLREPTAQEVLDAETAWVKAGSGIQQFRTFQLNLVAKVSGISADILDLLPVRKVQAATMFLQGLLDTTPAPLDPLPDTHTVELAMPVKAGGLTYTGIALSEPSMGAVRLAESAFGQGINVATNRRYKMLLVSRSGEVPWAAICEMPVSKVDEAAAYCASFLADGPAAGAS